MAKGLAETYATVASHFHSSLATTLTDARHDSVFGLVLYGINLAYAVCISNAHHRVEGRTALRSMVECYIALAFLLKRDQSGLWQKYRSYGSGQAKLAFLKSFDLDDRRLPDYVNVIELEAMANEDAWMEFVAIDVGHWAGADLRRMSEEAGVKEIYDKVLFLAFRICSRAMGRSAGYSLRCMSQPRASVSSHSNVAANEHG